MVDLGQVADDEGAQIAREIIAQREDQRLFRGREMKNIAESG